MYVRRDFQITNAALGEELRSESGRSVVKVTHNPINPAVFDSDSDSEDEELDSELEDELMDEFELDEEDDEEEDDEEEEVEAKVGKKVNGKKADVDGEDEEDEDEDDEDEDDEDFSDDEDVLETSVLCSLTAGKVSDDLSIYPPDPGPRPWFSSRLHHGPAMSLTVSLDALDTR
jgi:FK506-binding nuclear protein